MPRHKGQKARTGNGSTSAEAKTSAETVAVSSSEGSGQPKADESSKATNDDAQRVDRAGQVTQIEHHFIGETDPMEDAKRQVGDVPSELDTTLEKRRSNVGTGGEWESAQPESSAGASSSTARVRAKVVVTFAEDSEQLGAVSLPQEVETATVQQAAGTSGHSQAVSEKSFVAGQAAFARERQNLIEALRKKEDEAAHQAAAYEADRQRFQQTLHRTCDEAAQRVSVFEQARNKFVDALRKSNHDMVQQATRFDLERRSLQQALCDKDDKAMQQAAASEENRQRFEETLQKKDEEIALARRNLQEALRAKDEKASVASEVEEERQRFQEVLYKKDEEIAQERLNLRDALRKKEEEITSERKHFVEALSKKEAEMAEGIRKLQDTLSKKKFFGNTAKQEVNELLEVISKKDEEFAQERRIHQEALSKKGEEIAQERQKLRDALCKKDEEFAQERNLMQEALRKKDEEFAQERQRMHEALTNQDEIVARELRYFHECFVKKETQIIERIPEDSRQADVPCFQRELRCFQDAVLKHEKELANERKHQEALAKRGEEIARERNSLQEALIKKDEDFAQELHCLRAALAQKDTEIARESRNFQEQLNKKDDRLAQERASMQETLCKKDLEMSKKILDIDEERRSCQEALSKNDMEVAQERQKFQEELFKKSEELVQVRSNIQIELRKKDEEIARKVMEFEQERRSFQEALRKKSEDIEKGTEVEKMRSHFKSELCKKDDENKRKEMEFEQERRSFQEALRKKGEEVEQRVKAETSVLQEQIEALEANMAQAQRSLEALNAQRVAQQQDEQKPDYKEVYRPVEATSQGEMTRRNFSRSLLPVEGVAAKSVPGETADSEEMTRCQSISCLELVADSLEKAHSRELRRSMPPRYTSQQRDVPVVIVASEMSPWSKTGGLAMVTASFAYEFAARGRRTLAISPMYKEYEDLSVVGETIIWLAGENRKVRYLHQYQDYGNGCGCDYVFVDHECYRRPGGLYCSDVKAGREYDDNLFRFGLFCLAALEAPLVLQFRDQPPLGERVCFVANDWQAGLVPLYLVHKYRRHGTYKKARCIYVVHNMGYQGRYCMNRHPPSSVLGLDEAATSDLRFDNAHNLSKAAIVTSDRVVTVSPTYAKEIQSPEGGFGLHEVVRSQAARVVGILNGIDDSWDPRTDAHIACNYTAENFQQGKRACKATVQGALGLAAEPRRPLIGFIGRLTHQKGIDVLGGIIHWLMQDTGNGITGNVQLAMMGDGEHGHCEMLRNAERNYKSAVCGYTGFDPIVEHQMMAGCDLLLMPSRYEPCGLPQMYCQAYGTLPVVHATGGLRDSVQGLGPNENAEAATGFVFSPLSENELKKVLYHALDIYVRRPEIFLQMQKNAMARDFYWPQAIDEYERQIDLAMET